VHDLNQLFGSLGTRIATRCGRVDEMVTDVVFDNFRDEAVERAPTRGDLLQDRRTLGLGLDSTLNRFQLAAYAPNPGQELLAFPQAEAQMSEASLDSRPIHPSGVEFRACGPRTRLAFGPLFFALMCGAAHGAPDDEFSLHWQATYVEQESLGFNAPYRGPNSLSPNMGRETVDTTLFAGARLWSGAEVWLNPEIDQGYGLDNTLGVAGFPSGEAYKVGDNQPYFRLPRLFVRDILNLDDTTRSTDGGANQFECACSADRLVFTFGKIGVTDIFDINRYAHDPRGDFLNWSLVDAGTFDYAADAWGYTVGAAVEWYQGAWTLRGGVFDLSDVPNSTRLDPGFHEFQMVAELERRYESGTRTGRILLTAFDSRGRMGLLDAAVSRAQETDTPVNITTVRSYRGRLGVSLDLEQPLTDDLGLFARAGKAQGNVEVYEFADIDRSVSAGLSLQGAAWHRPDDTVAVATVINDISGAREAYLNAGGLGILVGDGKLPHPGPEKIVETYYKATFFRHVQVTLDYQWVENPGYNRDRGPVPVIAVRTHVEL
jgi:high affinity Mn2+ porin